MTGIGEQIAEGMMTVGNASSAQDQDGSISGELVLDLNRSPPVDGCGDGQNGTPIAACIRASPVAVDLDRSVGAAAAVDLDRSPVAGAEGSQIEAPIAAGTLASPVVVDLDQYSPVAGGGGSENEAPIAAGTQDSPIDVESLVDKVCFLSVPLDQSPWFYIEMMFLFSNRLGVTRREQGGDAL
jgi:hypothetical protein